MSKHIKNNGIRGLSVLVSSTINGIYSYINRHLIFYININSYNKIWLKSYNAHYQKCKFDHNCKRTGNSVKNNIIKINIIEQTKKINWTLLQRYYKELS